VQGKPNRIRRVEPENYGLAIFVSRLHRAVHDNGGDINRLTFDKNERAAKPGKLDEMLSVFRRYLPAEFLPKTLPRQFLHGFKTKLNLELAGRSKPDK
jgi:hypothetical protein